MTSNLGQSVASTRSLRAGPLSAEYAPDTGAIRNICFEGERVWTELVVLVRDDQWQVVPAEVTQETAQLDENEFSIVLRCLHHSNTVDFLWRGSIQGASDGTITYQFSGTAETEFEANRIGFSLLHPSARCAGQPIRQTRTDGSIVDGCFPQLIEPQIVGKYSIRDLSKLSHQLPCGTWAEATFEGDVFETEDQRNWMDASFKTYCTPLEQPFPVGVKLGDQRKQKVVLSIGERSAGLPVGPRTRPRALANRGARQPRRCRVWLPQCDETQCDETQCDEIQCEQRPAPQLGLTLNDRQPLTDGLRTELGLLGLSWLRTDLFISDRSWPQRLQNALAEARDLGVKLEVALQLPHSTPANVDEITQTLDREDVRRVLVYRCGHAATDAAIARQVRTQLPSSIQVGGGSDANFCELNREHAIANLDLTKLDVVAWSVNPQVHARDDQSVMETVHSLPAMVSTAKNFAQQKPIVISPITLRPRFNAVARGSLSDLGFPDPLVDERQHESFVATWMIAVWLTMAISDVTATSWFETHGPCGLLSSNPDKSNPVADAFRRIMAKAQSVVPCRVDTQDVVAAIVDYGSSQRLVTASLVDSAFDMTVECKGAAESTTRIRPYSTRTQRIRLSSTKRDHHD